MTRYDPASVRALTSTVLLSAGMAPRGAQALTDALLDADMRGVHSHGLSLLARYVHGFRSGQLNARPRIRTVRRRGAVATLDADNGIGHVAGVRAMTIAIASAKRAGIGVCAVRNSNHFGAAAYFARQAAANGMIGFATTNAPAVMAPWGGRTRMLGNNPISFAIPRRSGVAPIVLDMACSITARGKIRMAAAAGERIPVGWATDADGYPTDDPVRALSGLLLPAGGPKGYGLAVIVELLAAGLSAATMAPSIPDGPGEQYLSQGIGHLMLALDVGAFTSPRSFYQRVDRLAAALTAAEPAPGYDRVLLPGGIEEAEADLARRRGLELKDEVAARLAALAIELGIQGELVPLHEPAEPVR